MEMTAVVNKHHIRHGHMVNINRADHVGRNAGGFSLQVDRLSQRLVESARQAKRISCKTPPEPTLKQSFRRN